MRFSALATTLALFSTLSVATPDALSPPVQIPLPPLGDATAALFVQPGTNATPSDGACEIVHFSVIGHSEPFHFEVVKLPFAIEEEDGGDSESNSEQVGDALPPGVFDRLEEKGYRVVKRTMKEGQDVMSESQTWELDEEEGKRCKSFRYTTTTINLASVLSATAAAKQPPNTYPLDGLLAKLAGLYPLYFAYKLYVASKNPVNNEDGDGKIDEKDSASRPPACPTVEAERTVETEEKAEGGGEKDGAELV